MAGTGYRVLIFSASMGAGHDGAARELAARLRADGQNAEVRDFLEAGPLRIGHALRSGYEFELKHVPSAYDATYRFWHRVPWLCPLVAWLVCVLTRRRVRRHIRAMDANVVVSTYPLSTLCLGRLRRTGHLDIPAVNFITDFGVHPLWVDRGMDLNLAVHDAPARAAEARTGQPSRACGPVVSDAFWPDRRPNPSARADLRADLGLRPADAAVLVVAGSWGVGGIEQTLQAAAQGAVVPVVVCGRDEALRQRVQALVDQSGWRAVVLGWTDRMPQLMAACDALVENAGGLTSLEAMRAGLPVVSFRPIAGHGKDNTAAMSAAGVAHLATTPEDLADALGRLTRPGPDRTAQIAAGESMFREDAAALVTRLAAAPVPIPVTARPPALVAARLLVSLGAALGLVWAGLTTGVGVAAASGAGVAHPMVDAGRVAFIGVRLDASQIQDPQIQSE
ncbi:MAG: MGDG synthase family glycosyltransferase, partial [Acidimicrobiales bacterium]